MIKVPIELYFTPKKALFFDATEENFKNEIADTIDCADNDYWVRIFEKININNKDKYLGWFLKAKPMEIVNYGKINMESISCDCIESDSYFTCTIEMLFDETLIDIELGELL